jgi:hypothetical protein
VVAVAVTARTVIVLMVIVVVVGRLGGFIMATVVVALVFIMAFMIPVVVPLMIVMVVGFRHVLLRLFIEGHLAAGSAEVIVGAFVFALPTRRVVGIHIHLADRVYRCRH